jgi:aldehyde dehydrogenase (NAD+)
MNNVTSIFREISAELGITNWDIAASTGQSHKKGSGKPLLVHSPVDGTLLATLHTLTQEEYNDITAEAQKAFLHWRSVPAPVRGQIVREIGEELRKYRTPLGKLVTLEMGKILQEGLGEVQEMIDVCDFAVGLSRQLYGLTMHSERPSHRMYEQWHPIGIVGIISAFNFPVAVWSWNAMLAAVCGDVCIWKPSEKTPLTAIACQCITARVLEKHNLPEGIFNLMIGDAEAGQWMTADPRVGMVSATGSVRMGRKVGEVVAARLGKALLELGGNNAIIVTPDANIEMAVRAIVFGSVGTCGQRCTSTRRLIIHEQVYDNLVERLKKAYANLPIGDPLKEGTLVGPMIDGQAVQNFIKAQEELKKEGGKVIAGGKVLEGDQFPGGRYVQPALAEAQNHFHIVQEETFAPILYLIRYSGGVEEAIAIQNNVRQGLSSSIFSQNLRETELFLSQQGSDCGIANVNIGTSGAEIGGAFGGEKETGGGRESGSDAWKAYMRRQTNTINYGQTLPLAQGIRFEI